MSIVIWTTTPWTLPANRAVCLRDDLEYVLIQTEGDNAERIIVAAELAKDVMDRAGIEHFHNLGFAKGADLELSQFQHPFYDFTVPAILGDHVTTDSGTGVVHTAPGHGQEDFAVGNKYNLEVTPFPLPSSISFAVPQLNRHSGPHPKTGCMLFFIQLTQFPSDG